MSADGDMLLSDFLLCYYLPFHLGLTAGSVHKLALACRLYSSFLGRAAHLSDLSERGLLAWLQSRLQTQAPWTAKRNRGELLALWRFAAKRGLTGPVPDIPSVRVPRKVPVAWRLEEFERLIVAARETCGEIRGTGISKSAWWSSLLIFLYWSGARVGATLRLTPADFNLEQRFVRLQAASSKTDVEQVLSLHDQVIAALAGHWCPHRARVWPWPYNRRWLWVSLKRLIRKAGLPADRYHAFHAIRRTNYTLTVRFGSREMASRQLGHSTDMSRHYLDTTQLPVQSSADVLPAPSIARTCSRQLRLF